MNFEKEPYEGYLNKLKGKLFGLLCEKDKVKDRAAVTNDKEEWEKFLDSILLELSGWAPELQTINYITLVNKLNSLRYLEWKYFRKVLFEAMNLVGD